MLPQPSERRSRGHSTLPALQLLLSRGRSNSSCRHRLDTDPGVAHVPAATRSRPSHWEPCLKKANIASICISQFIHKHWKPRSAGAPSTSLTVDSGEPARIALTHSVPEQNKSAPPPEHFAKWVNLPLRRAVLEPRAGPSPGVGAHGPAQGSSELRRSRSKSLPISFPGTDQNQRDGSDAVWHLQCKNSEREVWNPRAVQPLQNSPWDLWVLTGEGISWMLYS